MVKKMFDINDFIENGEIDGPSYIITADEEIIGCGDDHTMYFKKMGTTIDEFIENGGHRINFDGFTCFIESKDEDMIERFRKICKRHHIMCIFDKR